MFISKYVVQISLEEKARLKLGRFYYPRTKITESHLGKENFKETEEPPDLSRETQVTVSIPDNFTTKQQITVSSLSCSAFTVNSSVPNKEIQTSLVSSSK
jgi:hypothetical protein